MSGLTALQRAYGQNARNRRIGSIRGVDCCGCGRGILMKRVSVALGNCELIAGSLV
jgi:hypothetical protein